MKSIVSLALALTTILVAHGAAEAAEPKGIHPATPDEISAAIQRGVSWLEKDMVAWRAKRKCAACHHGPLYLAAIGSAAKSGFSIDAPLRADMAKWILESPDSRIFPAQEKSSSGEASGPSKLSLAIAYLSPAIGLLPESNGGGARLRQRINDHLLKTQREDGGWTGPGGRPPLLLNDQQATQLASSRLDVFESSETQPRGKADAWLAKQPADDSHQALIWRIWGDNAPQDPPARKLLARLRELQQPDGGWRQTEEMASDAFATGQSLQAFARAQIPASDPAVQRALAFLVRTQAAEGNWPMVSRPHPENGSRARNLNPITYAGSAWGVIGLTSYTKIRGKSESSHSAGN